ncbi:oxidoreductase C-terminal domain-containing protein [Enterococcus alcedinis]|uniref:oxidoreductase C-terminal domain-containing protein n=1 Tax=Enterococcus alcedinis TaxID=1274384 RepID=UPI0036152412
MAHNIIQPKSEVYATRPYFWTDEYDQTFEYLGHTLTWNQTVTRGSSDEPKFTIAYLDENRRPLGVLFANNAEKRADIAALMDKNLPINLDRFKDPTISILETTESS